MVGEPIFHLLRPADWSGQRSYAPESLSREGFVHFSRREQILRSADRFFVSESQLLVLEVDPAQLLAPLRYEEADGELFPHLYGPLNREAVLRIETLSRRSDGGFALPAGF